MSCFLCSDWDGEHYEELMPVTNTAPVRCLLSTILKSQSVSTLILIFSQMDLIKKMSLLRLVVLQQLWS
jgi:hypothetical protein